MICNELNVKSYFCNPYHSWEIGAVEYKIGLIQDLPQYIHESVFASIHEYSNRIL